MWQFEPEPEVARRLKKLQGRHPDEIAAVYANLDAYVDMLEENVNPLQIVRVCRYVRNEGNGVYAIDQSPLSKGYAQIRLYVFPDAETKRGYLLTIGTKADQRRDVKDCHEWVRRSRKK